MLRSQKEELLRELEKLGCVEFSELDESFEEAGLTRENSDLIAHRNSQNALQNALQILDRYNPEKKPLLSAKPQVLQEVLLDDARLESALEKAAEINDLEDQVKKLTAEEGRQNSFLEQVLPWKDLDLPLGLDSTERASVIRGSIPMRVDLSSVTDAVAETTEEAELFSIYQDKSVRYVVIVCIKEAMQAVQECLRPFGFTAISFGAEEGTARECSARTETRLEELAQDKEQLRNRLSACAEYRGELQLASDIAAAKTALAEADAKTMGLTTTAVMEGWVPAECEKELGTLLERFDCAWETEDPEEEDYSTVPVLLKNNRISDSMNMVTNMYSLPAYGSVDPNPLMAPFFILFYGLMMADMGYGLIMMIAALVAMSKIKPRGGTLSFCRLLLYGGVSTFVMGALTGGFFGNAPEVIAGMFGSSWKGLPYLFSPVHNSSMVLYGAMVLGVIHLNTGMVINAVKRTKRGDLMGAIFEEGSQWVILVGGVLLGLQMLIFKDAQVLRKAGLAVLVIGALMLLYGSTRGAKGIGKLTAPFGCIYNTLTGWFGDVLSYSRIMALMLAGGVVAQVFNTIAAMPSANGVTPVSGIIFIVIFLIGHVLNFALNLLGCFVHDLRLQCLEFFGKFYEDGGKPFAPLSFRTKYYYPEQ